MVDEYGLTLKQRRWCDLYIKYGDGTKAAREAGYKYPERSAKDNGQKRPCKAYLAQHLQPEHDKRIADAEEVLVFLSATVRGEVKDQFGLDASLQDRIKAAQELLKRYAVADQRQSATLQRLDAMFISFKTAVNAPPVIADSDNVIEVDAMQVVQESV